MKSFSRKAAKTQRFFSAAAFAPLRLCVSICISTSLILICFSVSYSQTKPNKSGSHSTRPGPTISPEAKELLDQAIGVVCTQAKLDPMSSIAIDDMQARPSLPIHSPEARAGAERAQRLLPVAKSLVITSLRQLTTEYGFQNSPKFNQRIRQAIARVNSVARVRPDMESRDNASVYLSRPHVITFGTLFLAGLRSDEGMLSVLAHELTHIADGDNDSLRPLVAAVGNKASDLTGLEIHGQRAEEISCDLVGAMVVRTYIVNTPGYESIARRLARSIQHNCVELDEGDEDHLSPRNTIRALLALNPNLVRELLNDRF
jgi:Zn-dependent protease with chaperone function